MLDLNFGLNFGLEDWTILVESHTTLSLVYYWTLKLFGERKLPQLFSLTVFITHSCKMSFDRTKTSMKQAGMS